VTRNYGKSFMSEGRPPCGADRPVGRTGPEVGRKQLVAHRATRKDAAMITRMYPHPARGRFWRTAFLAGVLLGGLAAGALAQQPAPAADSSPTPPAADPVEGTWLGIVTAPQGSAEIGFKFARNAKGVLNFALYFPLMNTFGVTFDVPVAREGDVYTEPVLNSRLQLQGDKLTGTFGPGKLPVALTRGGAFTPAPPAPKYPAGPAPLWTHPLGSLTWAAPVVADGVVYVGTREGKIHAVHAADGTAVWTWTGPNRIDGRAVAAGDNLCFVDGKNDLVCLNRADGTLRWRTALYDEKLAGKPLPDNPTFNRRTATPLVLDSTVYCGSADGGLYALGATNGAKLWRYDAGAPIFSGAGLSDTDSLMFGTMDGSVVLLDRRTQKEIRRGHTGGGVVTTPVVAGDKVLVGSRDYFLYGLNLADGSVAWKFSYWFSWVESTGVLRDGVFYVGASDYRRVSAFDPATGRARWGTDVRGLPWGTPLVVGDSIFIGTVAQNIPGTAIEHTGGLMALDRRTGAVKWQLLAPKPPENSFGGYAGSLATDGQRIFAASFDGSLIALPVE
jgi:outer membrane protein assembly factor BamB